MCRWGYGQRSCPKLRGAGLLLSPWRRRDAVTLGSLQRIVHGLPTAHTRSTSKPLPCSRVGPQLGAQWAHPWVSQNPDLGLLLLPSRCPWVGLGDLHSCSSVWHGHGNPEKPARARPSSVPWGSTALETQWLISSKNPGPEAQGPTCPTPPWARSSKDFVAHLLYGPEDLGTWSPQHLSGDSLVGWPSSGLCVKSSADGSTIHIHLSPCSVLVLSSIPDGLMAWPLALISAQHPPWLPAWLRAMSLEPQSQGVWIHWVQVLPGHCPCTQGVLGQHLHMTAFKCQGKAPCCFTSHPEYPMEMLSPVVSSVEQNDPSLCGPELSSYGTAAGWC